MQFERALQCLLQHIHRANPRLGPVFLSKVDITDGFHRAWLEASNTPKLAVVFPSRENEEPLVGLPLTLPMGWKELPPHFCAATETVADIANQELQRHTTFPAHWLDDLAKVKWEELWTAVAAKPIKRSDDPHCDQPLQHWDVCMDDFVGLAQGNKWQRKQIKRALFGQSVLQTRPRRQQPPTGTSLCQEAAKR